MVLGNMYTLAVRYPERQHAAKARTSKITVSITYPAATISNVVNFEDEERLSCGVTRKHTRLLGE
jgi:hypothetical protein